MSPLSPGRSPACRPRCSTQQLRDALGELLRRAQRADAVRDDVATADVIAVLTGASLAIREHADHEHASRRVLAIVCDGLRASR